MAFSSLIFLYAFFPLSMLCYWLCPGKKSKNGCLLVFSLIFYGWGEPKYVFLLMFMAFSAWLCALGIQRSGRQGAKKLLLALSCAIDIGLIGYFKYAGLLVSLFGTVPEWIQSIALPIGISFYTFQLLTYVVDVYRGDAPAQRSYFHVLLYAALFHQCIAGPIVRYKTIDGELFGEDERQPQLALGVSRFCAGLAKKALLANPCGSLAEALILSDTAMADATQFAENAATLGEQSVLGAWVGLIAYALHIYLDFSAYSDMAIGMGWMLGLHYPENFRYPYLSRSVTDFWRRWHMSLGTFFRDYVYIPLGGSRRGTLRTVLNTLVVWALTGLWHGASWNFLLWGLWFFLFLTVERLFLKKALDKLPLIPNLYLLLVVMLGWVIFRYSDVRLGLTMVKSLFGLNGNPLSSFTALAQLKSHMFLLAAAVLASTPLAQIFRRWAEGSLRAKYLANPVPQRRVLGTLWSALLYGLIPVALLLLSTAALVGDSYNPFIYFQF